ncbi:MAG: biotin-dependent carboxyltransferase family protein [Bacteroidetes bacterium]|nr:MAG: biotin-dependent carboxyltransferase family protein [Bacteroidota bacterium]
MSLKILKPGILDTIQDEGRYGYQHLGINPSGAMDKFAMKTANLLIGNKLNEPVLEIFFPSPDILFEQNALITITGANFSPMINGDGIKTGRPVMVKKNTVIQFPQNKKGQCCYLAIHGGFKITPWLNSCSTNLKAVAGGFEGRKLQRGDCIEFNKDFCHERLKDADIIKLHWRAAPFTDESGDEEIFVLPGNEWSYLAEQSRNIFCNNNFQVALSSDRMGYRLSGNKLISENNIELVSAAVNSGTIQLLPNGELIVLMADSQTTGGYPRIAHVISAHLPKLAQKQPGSAIKFTIVNQAIAESLMMKQKLHLQQLKNACNFRLQDILK